MKPKQIKSLLGLALILIVAVLMDFTYQNARTQFQQTFDTQRIRTMFELRPLGLVILYIAFFIAGFPLITGDYSIHLPTWIMIVVGLILLIPLTFPLRWPFSGILLTQLDPLVSSHVGATLHLGAILTALGFYRLGRSFISIKNTQFQ
jgi:hypothetical protein